MADTMTSENMNDAVISGRTFAPDEVDGKMIRRSTLTDCVFKGSFVCDFRNSTLIRCRFDQIPIECRFDGAKIVDCNITLFDTRTGVQGYPCVIHESGASVGCVLMTWDQIKAMSKKQLIAWDRKNAVVWWNRYGDELISAGRKLGWCK